MSSIQRHSDHRIAVLRTENMWDDIIHLDKTLGGTGNFSRAGLKMTHGSESWKGASKADKNLSPPNTRYLCCILYKEMIVYQQLILESFNLSDEQKVDTMNKLLTHCQIETPVKDLPFSWENFYNTSCNNVLLDVSIS